MSLNQRTVFLLALLTCAGLLSVASYMEHGMGLEPCPLCIFQRLFVMLIGATLLTAMLHNPGRIGRGIYAALTALLAIGGGLVAGRQVWLQHLPEDQVPSCGPSLDYMLEVFPLRQTLELVFRGSGECAEVDWTLLGFSIAEWMLVVFAGFLVFGLLLGFTRLFPR